MADSEHIERLKRSIYEWNQWRHNHPGIRPNLSGSDLSGANLSGSDLSGANLSVANLIRADLTSATLIGADLSDTTLIGANLIGANLIDVILIGANLIDVILIGANLSDADLTSATLIGADLTSATLIGADLSNANLGNANLRGAKISGADLSGADLSGATLSNANLSRANLSRATLSGADLSGATLSGTTLSGANFWHTVFAEVDFCSVKGLVEINHRGSSIVELHSIQLPQDGSALHFLRGVGVPDDWIDFYQATMMHPIQYYSCFLSYSCTDERIAQRLHADLQANGVRCWFAPHDLKPGNYMRKEIDQAIHLQDKLLLILSESAVNSGWVGHEVEVALARELRQQREILFPIRLDNVVLQSASHWAATLQNTRHIGDFTNWTDPQTYQQTFDRLLRDLKKADV